MANGANGVHLQLREALEDYIKSQYFGKSPILLSAVNIRHRYIWEETFLMSTRFPIMR